jgi:hypothetical protein
MLVTVLMLLPMATEVASRLTIGSLTWHALTMRTARSAECRDSFDELVRYLRVEITNNRRPISEANLPGDVALVQAEYGIFQSSHDGVCTFILHPMESGAIIRESNGFDSRPTKVRFQGRKLLGSGSVAPPWGLICR